MSAECRDAGNLGILGIVEPVTTNMPPLQHMAGLSEQQQQEAFESVGAEQAGGGRLLPSGFMLGKNDGACGPFG